MILEEMYVKQKREHKILGIWSSKVYVPLQNRGKSESAGKIEQLSLKKAQSKHEIN